MKTTEITLYEFNELSDEAKEKALSKWANNEIINEFLKEDAEIYAELTNRYKDVNDIYFNISHSQSDYFTFEFEHLNEHYLNEIIDDLPLRNWEKNILKSLNYGIFAFHHGKPNAKVNFEYENVNYFAHPNLYEFIEMWAYEIESIINQNYTDDCYQIYFNLRNQLDYYLSEEYFEETCDANEYFFYEDGRLY